MAFGGANEKDIFSTLKSSSPCVVYRGLLELRSNMTKIKGENEVLKLLVDFLGKPNEKILHVTLSILANYCLDSDCRNKVSTRDPNFGNEIPVLRAVTACSLVNEYERFVETWCPNFKHRIAKYSFTLNVKAGNSSEIFVCISQTTRCRISENPT
jgi:hypothetical protein